MAFVASDRLSSLSSDQRHSLSNLIELLHARGQPRKGGKHKLQRWEKPHYVVARVAEARIKRWKTKNGKKTIPKRKHQSIVASVMRSANKWAMMQGQPPLDPTVASKDFERVEALLREPKSRRL
jgi:hypothetical protein